MTKSGSKLCMGCMTLKEHEGPCEKCGYRGDGPFSVDYLEPDTLLSERYIVGKLLSSNGESAVYIGYDADENYKIWIRELTPGELAARNHSTMEIVALKNCETIFKAVLAEFEDLGLTLQKMSTVKGIMRVTDVFRENGTVYIIQKYMNTMPLSEVLSRCGGEIKWNASKKMFLQFLNTLSQVHKKGLIHAGISPQTILIDENGAPFLSGFAVNATRAYKSELECQLFEGYSAPEQYENKRWYGEWTDVYAAAAVLYRIITGTMPPDSMSRKSKDNFIDAIALDENVPQNVSDAINQAMHLSSEARTQTVDAFSAQLLECPESNTAIYSSDMREYVQNQLNAATEENKTYIIGESDDIATPKELKKQQRRLLKQNKRTDKRETKKRRGVTFLSVFIPMLLTTLVLGILVWLFLSYKLEELQWGALLPTSSASASSESSSDSTSDSSTKPRVPDLVGQYLNTVSSNADYNARFDFEILYKYSDKYAEDVIMEQTPQAETLMLNRGTIILTVSKGSDSMMLPNLAGSTLELAAETLERLELSYRIIYVVNDEYSEGLVAATEPTADSSVKVGDEILIFTRKISDKKTESSDASSFSSSSKKSNKVTSSTNSSSGSSSKPSHKINRDE